MKRISWLPWNPAKPKTTNFEKIKSFNLEEMTEFLTTYTVCETCGYRPFENCNGVSSCKDGIRKWLESEADI